MATQKALVVTDPAPGQGQARTIALTHIPVPGPPHSGQVVVRVLATPVLSYTGAILSGARPYPLPTPHVFGMGAVARVEAVGPDATVIAPGQLVLVDITLRARDDPDTVALLGFYVGDTPAAQRLARNAWRDGTYTERATVPLENVFALDEDMLVHQRGYTPAVLCSMLAPLVGFAGLCDVGLAPGETVLIAPATGAFSSAAVHAALAMGACVVAAGRNAGTLKALKDTFGSTGRLKTVQLYGDLDTDTAAFRAASPCAGADVFLDFSPPAAAGSAHFAAGLAALRTRGRCVLAGGVRGPVEIPSYVQFMHKSLRIQGSYMVERAHVLRLIKMLEAGLLKLGEKAGLTQINHFRLDDADEAIKVAAAQPSFGSITVLDLEM
jgi:NADPH:quinone reductase-like Zn-dependent oxidoreductase